MTINVMIWPIGRRGRVRRLPEPHCATWFEGLAVTLGAAQEVRGAPGRERRRARYQRLRLRNSRSSSSARRTAARRLFTPSLA
jgi:hypothetical protein